MSAVQVVVAVAIMAVASVGAELVRRRRRADPPTQPPGHLPAQLDRTDFPGSEWLVAVFTSRTCSTCADVVSKARVVECDTVEVAEVAFQDAPDIHRRYRIDAVPCLVVADGNGVVRTGFLGPVTATDLWAAVAEARHPGSIDRTDGCGSDASG